MNIENAIKQSGDFQGLMQTLEGTWTSGTDTTSNWTDDYYRPWISSFGACYHNNNMETAFKILKVLLDKKLIKIDSVKDFIELIHIIKEEL